MKITRAKYKNLCIKAMHKLILEGYKEKDFNFSNGIEDDCPRLHDLIGTYNKYENNFILLKGTPYWYSDPMEYGESGDVYCLLSMTEENEYAKEHEDEY